MSSHVPAGRAPFPRVARGAVLVLLMAAGPGLAQPAFDKAFAPPTIGPGSTSVLTFTITNAAGSPVSELAFTDTLPAGVVLATPSRPLTTCGGSLSAPAGGSTISLAGGAVPAADSCTVRVDVTSSTLGVHVNVSGDLTSSAGNSGNATADLTVAADRPGFTKSFSPSEVPFGARSRLTFTIDNTANEGLEVNLAFTDTLPEGLEVASPAAPGNTCGGVLTAVPGSGSISLGFGSVDAVASCTVAVDVVARGNGAIGNTSGELTSSAGSSGRASAVLTVTVGTLVLTKELVDDPVAPGGTATLRFTVLNRDRDLPITGITFTDDLDATLTGLVAVGAPPADPCGGGSSLSGTSVLTLTGGVVEPGGSCTFDVTLQIPSDATSGVYPNTTSSITGDLGGEAVVGDPAVDDLFVSPAPLLTKEFVDDPVGAGGTVTLEFTLTNTSSTDTATGLAFQDVFDPVLPSAVSVPASGICGGATVTFFPLGASPARLVFSGGSLASGASCTFSLVLDVADGASGRVYPNATTEVTATVGGDAVTGSPATDDLVVVAAPSLTKEFTDDPVQPGDTVTLEFTLTHDELAPGAATGVAFTDDLAAALTGLAAVGLPQDDVCGVGSQVAGTTVLSLTGGSLAPGESCTFSVTLQVPAGALPGRFTNTTSEVSATVSGISALGRPGVDDLVVATLVLTKTFLADPVVAGDTVDLQFTITELSADLGATDIFFQDPLGSTLSGLTPLGLPLLDVCGMGSSLAASGSTLVFSGGSLAPGGSCMFTVTLLVPLDAADGSYANTTTGFSATVASQTVSLDNAVDLLDVDSSILSLTKSFVDDPVQAGGTVILRLGVENLSAAVAVTGITFTDDLEAALSGLVSVSGTVTDVCGTGSQISGTSLLALTGGSLQPGASCTFDVTLQVPAAAAPGQYVNTTSPATGLTADPTPIGTVAALPVSGPAATDALRVIGATLTKSFSGPSTPGGGVTLTFTIENLDDVGSLTGLGFTDDLDAVLSGLIATGLPAFDVCGAGSQLSGTSLLILTGASLAPGASCTFAVTLQVPVAASPGSYPNVTSDLLAAGLPVASPAGDSLVIEPIPGFSKVFAPAAVSVGGVSTLTFTVDNSGAVNAATALDFTDSLPAGLVVASPSNASTTCTGGTLTATAGTGVVTYTGGTVAAGSTCTVAVDVTPSAPGTLVNTSGDLTSSLGNSGPATATLEAGSRGVAIPTLSGWSLLLLLLGVSGVAMWSLRSGA